MIEVSCHCDEGQGCPHSHRVEVTVRTGIDTTVTMTCAPGAAPQGPQVVSTRRFLHYWGDDIHVSTNDLRAVLSGGPDAAGATARLRVVLDEHDQTLPTPDTPGRAAS